MSEMSALARSIGHKIRQCRLARNLTQEDLAKGLFSKSYISQLERGAVNPSLKALRLLADRLGVSCTWLLETGNSPPSLLIQAATTSFYLEDTERAKELLEMARVYQDAFTRRDSFEVLLLEARFFSLEQRWNDVISTCEYMDSTFDESDSLPRRHLVTQSYLSGTAWYNLGNQRQAIVHWEKGLAELNRCVGPPSPEGLSLLQALKNLYADLGDQHASKNIQARLDGTIKQVKSPADLGQWVMARRRDQTTDFSSDNYPIIDQTEDLQDAEAWARANVILTSVAELRKNIGSKFAAPDLKPG